jgi:hypothetical protein
MIPVRTHRWLLGIALALIALAVLAVALFDWNWMRGPVSRRMSAMTGRSFEINGDLSVHLSLWPRIVANDVVLGNAAWSRDPEMATIKRLDFRINLFRSLSGPLEITEMVLSEPHVVLEVNNDGMPNWVFDDSATPIAWPIIGSLSIDRGGAIYRNLKDKTDLSLEVKTLADGADTPEYRLDVVGKGRFKGLPTTLQARGGALLSLRTASNPYPVKGSAVIGATRASVNGMLLDPLRLAGEELNFTLEGSDMAQLYPITGVPLPPTPDYKLAGFLDHAGKVWTFRGFSGVVGQSNMAGDFSVDRSLRPQKITAHLTSQRLVMRDLGGFIGADRGERPNDAPPPRDKLMPAEPFSLEKLQAADADVHFRGEKIVTEKLPLEKMSAHLVVANGVLKLTPIDFWIAGGHLVSQIEMDGSQARIVTHADIVATGLRLGRMFPTSKLAEADTGIMNGRARLVGQGNSVAQLLASANGEAALMMDGGSVGELTVRLANLDIANSLMLLLSGDRQTPIRCMVANFKAINGDFHVKDLVLDTSKVNITGSGDVNFTEESLHLRLVSRAKGFSLVTLRGPIGVTGSFTNPMLTPEMGGVFARGGLAVALGAVTGGIAALIPLLDFGKDQDSNCAALIRQARADAGVKSNGKKVTGTTDKPR